MAKNSDNSLQAEIIEVLSRADNSIKINVLLESLKANYSPRTVQRALFRLLAEKLIYKFGNGPATSYKAIGSRKIESNIAAIATRTYADFIKLTASSKKVMAYVSQPPSHRRPIGYNREFLDSYTPNKTWYLDANTRALLHQIGKTQDELKPAGTYGREIMHRLLIDLSWASSKLEGNTYSRLDTKNLIDYEQYAEGKDATEAQMILNHKQAITFLVENIESIGFNKYTILNLHGLLSEKLLHDDGDSGKLRTKVVDIGGSVYKPTAIPQLITESFSTILDKAQQINDPFEQLFFIMVHIPYLQAFVDVNKRVSRLAANIPLLKYNLCPLTFVSLPEQAYIDANLGVYELQDHSLLLDVFVWAYERSAQEYLIAQKTMATPDLMHLKYRSHIRGLINKIVLDCNKDYVNYTKQYAKDHIADAERVKFEKMVLNDLRALHEGVLVRYDLNPEQFAAWVQAT